MTDPQPSELTPEQTAILARARRLFLISMGLLVIGFFAIGAVLLFRANSSGGSSGAEYAIAALKIPAGAEVVSAVAADGKLTVTYKSGATTSVRIFDGKSGEMIREIPVIGE